jgi:hypothetical protein
MPLTRNGICKLFNRIATLIPAHRRPLLHWVTMATNRPSTRPHQPLPERHQICWFAEPTRCRCTCAVLAHAAWESATAEWFRPVLTTSIRPYCNVVVVRIRLYTPRRDPREVHQKCLTSVTQHVLSLARFL